MENDIYHYIAQVKAILQTSSVKEDEKNKRGEAFNVFNILNLSRSEVRLHSAFLAELLNPSGCHGLEDIFLNAFMDELKKQCLVDLPLCTKKAMVEIEYPINGGYISNDGTEGGRLDIYIHDNQSAIIIENKIDAGDQENQMLRYWNYAKQKYDKDKFTLLYLTLDGHQPSDASLGIISNVKADEKDPITYECISYKDFINKWLERCIQLSAEYSLIRSTIRQYINNIQNITYMTFDNKNLVSEFTKHENMDVTIAVIENIGNIGRKIREDFVNSVKNYADQRGFEVKIDDGFLDLQRNKWMRFYLPYSAKEFYVVIGWGTHTNNDGAQYAIQMTETGANAIKAAVAENRIVCIWDHYANSRDTRPCGWDYFWSNEGYTKDNRWWRWDETGTWKVMANGELLKYIKENVLSDRVIEQLKILDGYVIKV